MCAGYGCYMACPQNIGRASMKDCWGTLTVMKRMMSGLMVSLTHMTWTL